MTHITIARYNTIVLLDKTHYSLVCKENIAPVIGEFLDHFLSHFTFQCYVSSFHFICISRARWLQWWGGGGNDQSIADCNSSSRVATNMRKISRRKTLGVEHITANTFPYKCMLPKE